MPAGPLAGGLAGGSAERTGGLAGGLGGELEGAPLGATGLASTVTLAFALTPVVALGFGRRRTGGRPSRELASAAARSFSSRVNFSSSGSCWARA